MTIAEIEAKKIKLQETMALELIEAKKSKPLSPEFNTHYDLYRDCEKKLANIDNEIEDVKKLEAQNIIKNDCASIAISISKMIEGLEIAKKLNEPVISLVYTKGAEADSIPVVFINKRSVTKLKGESIGVKGKGHIKIVDSQGIEYSLTGFVKAKATASELISDAFKYPHTQIDSLVKFQAFCTLHNLTGFEYRLPVKIDSGVITS